MKFFAEKGLLRIPIASVAVSSELLVLKYIFCKPDKDIRLYASILH